jgi:competence protein ComEA
MKKSAIFVMLAITLIFIAFISGLYVGKNVLSPGVRAESSTTTSPSSSATTHLPGGSDPMPTAPSTTVPVGTTKPVFPININTATAEELDLLPDIGPTRATAIVAYRTTYGPFSSVEDLLNVDGIGPKILEKILPYITV